MMMKSDIYALINKNDLFSAFEELNKFFLGNNDSLNRMQQEYINQPNNFDAAVFNNRLKSFASLNYKEDTKMISEPSSDELTLNDYELLCEIDFKLQADHFQLYKYKKIAAFLLHGETGNNGTDLKWLCNQMLFKEKLSNDIPIIIDLSSTLGGSFERLLEEFYVKFNIDVSAIGKTKPIVKLRAELEERLKTRPLVCIIKSSHNILASEMDMCKFYDHFLSYMNENIDQKNHSNALIMLFINNEPANSDCMVGDYFFWFSENERSQYLSNVFNCEDVKIIDLAPIQKIKESDITDWIRWTMHKQDVFKRTSKLSGKETDILQTGDSPFQVIEKICKELDIKIQAKWIT